MRESPSGELHRIRRAFGRGAASAKKKLLAEIESGPLPGVRARSLLAEAVEFLRAYPDDASILRAVERIASRLPVDEIRDSFAYGLVRRLTRLLPGCLGIVWGGAERSAALLDLLETISLPGEINGLLDTRLTLRRWLAQVKPRGAGDLDYIVGRLESSGIPEPLRCHLFDACKLELVYRGPAKSGLKLPGVRPQYQRSEIPHDRFPLGPYIRRPAGAVVRAGEEILDIALQALSARNLEIFPLIHANPDDVILADAGRAVSIAIAGVEPRWRMPLETLVFFMLFKNGVPVAYGPASVFGGCCEMGINLFPEFRGGEIRYLYGQLMRLLHHRMGVDHFFLTRYGMGEDNKDAIDSGAFWFYRKLGFKPTNPEVEALAREEEARRAIDPSHRSDRRMLRRLSKTEACLDLSDGRRRPLDFGRLSIAESRHLGLAPAGDRRKAVAGCAARVGRATGLPPGLDSLRAAAPTLALIRDLPSWPRADRTALGRFLRAKNAVCEAEAARLGARHSRLIEALRRVAAS